MRDSEAAAVHVSQDRRSISRAFPIRTLSEHASHSELKNILFNPLDQSTGVQSFHFFKKQYILHNLESYRECS